MIRHLKPEFLAAGLIALGAASAAPPAAAQELVLTPAEEVVIYRAVTVAPYPPVYVAPYGVEWEVVAGAPVPYEVPVYPLPPAVEAPAVEGYSYAVVQERLLLVDPVTREVVEVIDRY